VKHFCTPKWVALQSAHWNSAGWSRPALRGRRNSIGKSCSSSDRSHWTREPSGRPQTEIDVAVLLNAKCVGCPGHLRPHWLLSRHFRLLNLSIMLWLLSRAKGRRVAHLRRMLASYSSYYNESPTHFGVGEGMRRYGELSRGAERSSPRQFFPDCTIAMCGYDLVLAPEKYNSIAHRPC
jgi:hypothetical protein